MKSSGSLYHKIHDPENLRDAFLKASRGKRDRNEIIAYVNDLQGNLALLSQQIEECKLDIGYYRFFTVHDPKKREICAASFPERVLHHAIMNICEPALERYAIHDTYACRKDKGHRKAVLRAQYFCRQYPWFLKLDIRKYFDSISHHHMLNLLARIFREQDLLTLFDKIFMTYQTDAGKGLPIGNLVSQHCANVYLGVLDHWLKDELGVKGYVRYMDDFLIFSENKAALNGIFPKLRNFLDERLALELKDNIQLNRCLRGIPFLGYRIFPNRIMLGTESKRRFVQKFIRYERTFMAGNWSEKQLAEHSEPLVEFTRLARAGSFRQVVFNRHGVYS
jgi:RNA-directed DNA polymerase